MNNLGHCQCFKNSDSFFLCQTSHKAIGTKEKVKKATDREPKIINWSKEILCN